MQNNDNTEECQNIGATLKSVGVLIALLAFVLGTYFGVYVTSNPPTINNPFAEWQLIKNEEELRQSVGEYLNDKEAMDCNDEDIYYYTSLNLSPDTNSRKNFKLVCGYYSNIRIHEEYEVVKGQTWTKYCDQEDRCVYGGKQPNGYQF